MINKFIIDKHVVGTPKHIMCLMASKYVLLSKEIPTDVWCLSGTIDLCSNKNLDSLIELNLKSINTSLPQKFQRALELLKIDQLKTNVPWMNFMPRKEHKVFTEALINEIHSIIPQLKTDYYDGTWCQGNEVLCSLKRAKLNVELWKELKHSSKNSQIFETFKPSQGGWLQLPKYDRFGQRTGRMTIAEGPNILHLPKEARKMITSRFEGGKIFLVDFANLEPRIVLQEANKTCDNQDLYDQINKDEFDGNASRDNLKGAVISELYGMNKFTLSKKLKISIEQATHFMFAMQRYFETPNLTKRLIKMYSENGCIINRFGRKIRINDPLPNLLLNSYVQSTGVDVSLLGFREILHRCNGKRIVPLYVLVDALILDVHPDEISFIEQMDRRVKVSNYSYDFFVTVKEI